MLGLSTLYMGVHQIDFNSDLAPSRKLTCEGRQQATVIRFDGFSTEIDCYQSDNSVFMY